MGRMACWKINAFSRFSFKWLLGKSCLSSNGLLVNCLTQFTTLNTISANLDASGQICVLVGVTYLFLAYFYCLAAVSGIRQRSQAYISLSKDVEFAGAFKCCWYICGLLTSSLKTQQIRILSGCLQEVKNIQNREMTETLCLS
jgi:predicted Co/Zn/Cd cation transporter (cation efflux family)